MLRNLLGPCTLKEVPKPAQTLLSQPRTVPRGVRASPVHATSIHTACGDTDASPSFLGAVPPAPSLLLLGRSPHSTRADHSRAPRFRVNMLTLGLQRGSLASGGIQGATSSPVLTLGIPRPAGARVRLRAWCGRTAAAPGWPRWLRARLGRAPPAPPPPQEPGQASSLGLPHA